MKTRRTSRLAACARCRMFSAYCLVGAGFPLALNGCSSDAPSSVTQPAPAFAAPASGASAEMPGTQAPAQGKTPTTTTGTPAASGEVQPVMGLAMPGGDNGGGAVTPAAAGAQVGEQPSGVGAP